MQRTVPTAAIGTVPTRSDRAVRLAALGGLIGPVLFATVIVAAGFAYAGYSHLDQKISELGGDGAEYALVQNANFVVFGLLVVGFAWALARVLGPPFLGPALIAYFGLSSSVANGLLPCDPGCEGETTVGLLHIITGLTGFVAAIAGMVVLAGRFERHSALADHARPTRLAAGLALAGLLVFVVIEAADVRSWSGLVQRSFAMVFLTWISVTAFRLVRAIDTEDGADRTLTSPARGTVEAPLP